MLRNRIFNLIFLAACVLPFAGMAVYTAEESAGNESAAEWPSFRSEDGTLNSLYLSEIGDYIEDHFAFRSELITLNSLLRTSLLNTSTDEDVIAGTDNWLYYAATLDDYQHMNNVSDRILFNEAHNIALVQEWAEANGKTFVFTVAPNKNTLYPDNMPSSLNVTYAAESDFTRLAQMLAAEGVNYVDMVSLFDAQEEVLYYARDSHWTETGAILAYNALLDAAGVEHETYEDTEPVITTDYYGDLSEMIYPSGMYPEDYELYLTDPSFLYVAAETNGVSLLEEYIGSSDISSSENSSDSNEMALPEDSAAGSGASLSENSADAAEDFAESAEESVTGVAASQLDDASALVEQDTVVTYNAQGSGSLYMYRDSFGNSLLPYMAETFESAVFSEIVPWDLTSEEVLSADVIIMEKVERHLPTLSGIAPIMPALEQNLSFSYSSGEVIGSVGEYLQYLVTGEEPSPGLCEITEVDDALLYEESDAATGTTAKDAASSDPEDQDAEAAEEDSSEHSSAHDSGSSGTESHGTVDLADTIDGNYMEITGTVSEDICAVNGRIYAAITDDSGTAVYEAFCVDTSESDYGYTLYLSKDDLEGEIRDIRIVVRNGSVWTCVCEYRTESYDSAREETEALAQEILETYGEEDPALAWARYLAVQEAAAQENEDAEDSEGTNSEAGGDSEGAGGDSGTAAEDEDGSVQEASEEGADAEEADLSTVVVSRRYIEDCGLDSGYWEITYADGHQEYIDD